MTPFKYFAALLLAVGIFGAGYMANRRQAPPAPTSNPRQALYYTCPMHPEYKSAQPGNAPCCGMRLVAVYAGESNVVEVGSNAQHLLGIQTEEVRNDAPQSVLRAPGRVVTDDSRLYRVMAAADGWIRQLGPNPAGTRVGKDQVLASYYTPNLLAASQTMIYGIASNEQSARYAIGTQRGPTSTSLIVAIDSLRSLGMHDLQLEELKRTRQATSEINVYAPAGGYVVARSISPGQRFDKGAELYRIADISHVWILTDIFERDRALLKPGATARVRCGDREFTAQLSDALPQLDPQSRTLKTRFELDNPDSFLRPDTFVDVEVSLELPSAITVPADAVIDSGLRKTVYVEAGSGVFESRIVKTGWRLADRVQVVEGLARGERVVVSGNFLIDSESRMKSGAAAALATGAQGSPAIGDVAAMRRSQ